MHRMGLVLTRHPSEYVSGYKQDNETLMNMFCGGVPFTKR